MKYIIFSLLVLVGLAVADCPYSGYVPGSPGVVVSRWVDVSKNYTTCYGICPTDLIEIETAWQPLNRTGNWAYHDGQWWEQFWKCEDTARMGSLIQDCRLYEKTTFTFTNQSKVGGDVVGNQTVGAPGRTTDSPTFTINKEFILAIVKLLIG